MVSIWPVAAINKIKSKRKDLIKENDIRSSSKSRKNANIHFFLILPFGGGEDHNALSTLFSISWSIASKSRCVESLTVYVWPWQRFSGGGWWRKWRVGATMAPLESLWRSRNRLNSQFEAVKSPLSALVNWDKLFGNLRESQHCSTLVHVFWERKFFLARQNCYTEPTSQIFFYFFVRVYNVTLNSPQFLTG